jgi:putative transposase
MKTGQFRKSMRLKGYDYAEAGGYFVTVVAHRRACMFGEIACGEVRLGALGRIVTECWQAIPDHFPRTEVDAFVVMPNHIHGIIFIHDAMVGATYIVPEWGYVVPTTT